MLVGAGLGFETALDARARPQRRRPGAYAVEKQASAVSPVPSTSRSRLAVLSEWISPNSEVPNVTEAPELGSRKTCRASARVEAQEKATSTRTTAIESARRDASRLDCMSFRVFLLCLPCLLLTGPVLPWRQVGKRAGSWILGSTSTLLRSRFRSEKYGEVDFCRPVFTHARRRVTWEIPIELHRGKMLADLSEIPDLDRWVSGRYRQLDVVGAKTEALDLLRVRT